MISNDEDLLSVELGQHPKQKKLAEGLRINIHYRAIPESVWKILSTNYGGGPAIVRESIDIYSREIASIKLMAK